MDENGWDTWRKYVLLQLQDNKGEHERIAESLSKISNQLADLKNDRARIEENRNAVKKVENLITSVDQKITILQTEHRVGKFLGTTVIAAVVSLIVSVLGHIFKP